MFIMKHCVLHITLCSKSNTFKFSFFLRSRCGQCFEVHDFHHDFYCLQYIQLVEIIVTWHEPLHLCCPTLCTNGAHIKLQSLVCIIFSRPILALHPFFFLLLTFYCGYYSCQNIVYQNSSCFLFFCFLFLFLNSIIIVVLVGIDLVFLNQEIESKETDESHSWQL